MSNPYSRVTTALTYMTGDAMEPWKEDQLNLLNGRVNTGILETDEQLWDLFEADFKQAFTNTHKARDTMSVTIHQPIFPFSPPLDHPVHSPQYRSLNL